MDCPNCASPNPAGATFCLTCGWDFPADQTPALDAGVPAQAEPADEVGKCANCGAKNLVEATFCSLCGNSLSPAVALAPAEPIPGTPALTPAVGLIGEDDGERSPEAQELSGLQREMIAGGVDAAGYARMAEIEMKGGHREQAARYLLEAIQRTPKEAKYSRQYLSDFDEKELKEWTLAKPPIPIWADIGAIIEFPFKNGEWLSLLLGSLFFLFMTSLGWSVMTLPLLLLGWGYVHSLMGKHIKWAALGKFGHPQTIEVDMNYLWYAFCTYLATFVVPVISAIIIEKMISPLFALVWLLGTMFLVMFIFPMSFLVSLMFNAGGTAFNYPFIVKSILRIFPDYLLSITLLYLGFGFYIACQIFLVASLPFGSSFPIAFIFFYFITAYAHILGRLYYNNQRELAWF